MGRVLAGLDRSVVALLSSKSTQGLLRFVGHADLILLCCALAAICRALPRAPVMGRLSAEMGQILFGVALSTALEHAATIPDTGAACVLLLAIHFWGDALDPDGEVSVTAQYLLAAALSARLDRGPLLSAAWGLAFAPVPPDVAELGRLLTTESLTTGLQDWLPRGLLLPSTAVLLYLCAPFMAQFPALERLYRFAVFAFTRDTGLAGVPNWLLAAGLYGVWQLETDPVSRRMASVAGSHLAVLVALDALRFSTESDGALTLAALLLAVRIFEDNAKKGRNRAGPGSAR